MTITKTNIEKLFDDLWPTMLYVHDHKVACLNQLEAIKNYFKKSHSDHDTLLINLCSLDGIGITIASGLIWSVYPENRVPFDKYTLSYALKERIIRNNNVSENYVEYSEKVKEYCNGYEEYSIEDFVREAWFELEENELLLIEPK